MVFCNGLERGLRVTAAALMASSALGMASAAQAQAPTQVAAADVPQGEIIVTATKRSESLQKVPISIQALSGATLAEHQVQSLDDYTKLLPSVSFQSFGPGQSQLYFRGIASAGDGLHSGPEPASGLYIDETPVTTIAGSVDLHVYDMARVEALSGPQGTLFGASSMAGTLRLITNKPDTSKFSAGYDLEGNKFGKGGYGGQAEGFVNIPMSETMAIRLVGFYTHDGGYIDNTLGERTYQRPHYDADGNYVQSDPLTINNAKYAKKDFNDVDTYGGRAALKVDLGDDWTATPMAIYQHQIGHGEFLYDPKLGDLKVHDFTPDRSKDEWGLASLTIQGKLSDWDVTYSGSYMRRTVDTISDYSYFSVAYDKLGDKTLNPCDPLTPSASCYSSYAGYNYLKDSLGNDIDPSQYQHNNDLYTKESHELRISSPADKRLRMTAGLFYQRQTDHNVADYGVFGLSNATDPYSPPLPGAPPNDVYYTNIHRVDRDYAAFSDISFDILHNLTLTGGLRVYTYKNTLEGFSGGLGALERQIALDNCTVQTVFGCPDIKNKKTDEQGETHKINLTWKIDPAKLVYFTYSTGFRPGGINRSASFQTNGVLQIQDFPPYAADTLTNYEVGWKTSFFNHSLRFNGALFWDEWNNLQYSQPGILSITYTLNVANARSRGFEGDFSWTPVHGLTLSASGTYIDAKLTTPLFNPSDGSVRAPAGTRLPIQPRVKLNATARYDFPIGDYKSFVQGTANYQSDSTSSLRTDFEDVLGKTKGFATFDFSAGTTIKNMTASVYIQNAFDKRGVLSINTVCSPSACGGYGRKYPIKPQIFGIRFGQKF
jgi:outer membrane receptor protein involved in Fe transport